MSSRKDTISNPIIWGHFANWARRHFKPEGDNVELETALQEARTEGSDLTLSEAIRKVMSASGTQDKPWITIQENINTQSVVAEQVMEEDALKGAEIVKQALEQGIIQPKDVGLYRKPPSELKPEDLKRLKAKIAILESELEKAQVVPSRPKFRLGDIVFYAGLGEAEVTDMEIKPNKMWEYTITQKGQEYIARENELVLAKEKPITPVAQPPPPPKKLTEEDIENLYKTFELAIQNRMGREPTQAEYENFIRCVEPVGTLEDAKSTCEYLIRQLSPETTPPKISFGQAQANGVAYFQTKEMQQWFGRFFKDVAITERFKAEEEEKKKLRPPPPPAPIELRVMNVITGHISPNVPFYTKEDALNYVRLLEKSKHKGKPIYDWKQIRGEDIGYVRPS